MSEISIPAQPNQAKIVSVCRLPNSRVAVDVQVNVPEIQPPGSDTGLGSIDVWLGNNGDDQSWVTRQVPVNLGYPPPTGWTDLQYAVDNTPQGAKNAAIGLELGHDMRLVLQRSEERR